jgi:membrane protein
MRGFAAVARDAGKIFSRNDCRTSAAAISFYAFFSLIPLMFIVTAGVGFLLGSRPDIQESVIGMVRENVPYLSPRIITELKNLTLNWKTFGWVGLISLLLGAELVMEAASRALTRVFDTKKKFGFVRKKLISFIGVLLVILAALASIALTAVSYYLEAIEVDILGLGYIYDFLIIILTRFIAPFFLVSGIITIVFKRLAGPNLDRRSAFFGSALFTVLWELAKQLFALYVANFQSYNKFYGSIGTLMILLMWIFYSANIFLFAASTARAAYLSGGYPWPTKPRK